MTVNVEAIERTLAYIEENPEQWNQESWGSCFAGITVRLNGGRDQITCCIPCTASRILGLEPSVYRHLFSSSNSLPMLRHLVAQYRQQAQETARRQQLELDEIIASSSTDRELVAL